MPDALSAGQKKGDLNCHQDLGKHQRPAWVLIASGRLVVHFGRLLVLFVRLRGSQNRRNAHRPEKQLPAIISRQSGNNDKLASVVEWSRAGHLLQKSRSGGVKRMAMIKKVEIQRHLHSKTVFIWMKTLARKRCKIQLQFCFVNSSLFGKTQKSKQANFLLFYLFLSTF